MGCCGRVYQWPRGGVPRPPVLWPTTFSTNRHPYSEPGENMAHLLPPLVVVAMVVVVVYVDQLAFLLCSSLVKPQVV